MSKKEAEIWGWSLDDDYDSRMAGVCANRAEAVQVARETLKRKFNEDPSFFIKDLAKLVEA